MTPASAILDATPDFGVGAGGLLIGGAILLAALVIAVIAFKLLKRSLKMAFKVIVVVMILIVAGLAALGVFVYTFIQEKQNPKKPVPVQRQR